MAAAEVADPAPGPAAKPVAQAAPMEIALQAVRRGSETVEIEVSLDEPLPPLSSMRPALQIGDEIAQRSRAGEGGRLDRLVFTVDAEQFERMPVDAGLILRAGVRSNEDATVKPKLGDVTITEIGGQP